MVESSMDHQFQISNHQCPQTPCLDVIAPATVGISRSWSSPPRPPYRSAHARVSSGRFSLPAEYWSKPVRIAQISPLYESVPPSSYGGTERVVSYFPEELAQPGHDVT